LFTDVTSFPKGQWAAFPTAYLVSLTTLCAFCVYTNVASFPKGQWAAFFTAYLVSPDHAVRLLYVLFLHSEGKTGNCI
jgi:hypothetical protein